MQWGERNSRVKLLGGRRKRKKGREERRELSGDGRQTRRAGCSLEKRGRGGRGRTAALGCMKESG